MKGDAKYKFAKSSTFETICVDDLNDSARKLDYVCLSCSNKLIPVMGEKNEWHFRHFLETFCSGETYLHKLGKEIFYQTYKSNLIENKPFIIRFPVQRICSLCKDIGFDTTKSCKLHNDGIEERDLTRLFPSILEPDTVKDGEFKPDVLLLNDNGDKIYIEIVVKHKSTEEKINSGAKIIEIFLKTEDDVQNIQNGLLVASNKVKFHNFPKTTKDNLETNFRCSFTFFVVDYRGDCKVSNSRLQYISDDNYNGDILYYKNFPDNYGGYVSTDDYFRELLSAYKLHGKRVKNCFLCKYHALNTYKDSQSKPIFCKVYKKANVEKTCSPSGALNCGEFYSPNEKYLTEEDREMEFKF